MTMSDTHHPTTHITNIITNNHHMHTIGTAAAPHEPAPTSPHDATSSHHAQCRVGCRPRLMHSPHVSNATHIALASGVGTGYIESTSVSIQQDQASITPLAVELALVLAAVLASASAMESVPVMLHDITSSASTNQYHITLTQWSRLRCWLWRWILKERIITQRNTNECTTITNRYWTRRRFGCWCRLYAQNHDHNISNINTTTYRWLRSWQWCWCWCRPDNEQRDHLSLIHI